MEKRRVQSLQRSFKKELLIDQFVWDGVGLYLFQVQKRKKKKELNKELFSIDNYVFKMHLQALVGFLGIGGLTWDSRRCLRMLWT